MPAKEKENDPPKLSNGRPETLTMDTVEKSPEQTTMACGFKSSPSSAKVKSPDVRMVSRKVVYTFTGLDIEWSWRNVFKNCQVWL